MTDLEITKLCAEALGYVPTASHRKPVREGTCCRGIGGPEDAKHFLDKIAPAHKAAGMSGEICQDCPATYFDPLHDDAQAMALVKKFPLRIYPPRDINGEEYGAYGPIEFPVAITFNPNLNRAICECVAKMQKEKK